VPVSSVPALLCASGAQCSPARTQNPFSPSLCAVSSQSSPVIRNDRTPVWQRSSAKIRMPSRRASSSASSLLSACSWRRISSMPLSCTKRSPAARPQIPAVFWVPASARSGRKSGISGLLERLPLPPSRSVAGFCPQSSKPVPDGPYKPLCPGIAMNAAPSSRSDTGSTPADCEASRMNGTPRSRQRAAIFSAGRR